MANKAQQTLRFVTFINQQLEVLKEECNTLKLAADDCIHGVQSEVDTWANGVQIDQETCEEVLIRIQKAITFFIAKSVELSGLHNIENIGEPNLTPVSNILESKKKTASKNLNAENSYTLLRGKETSDVVTEKSCVEMEANITKMMTMKFAILEEDLFSLKKTTEQVQEKQENVDRTLNDVSSQQENINKKIESFDQTNLNFRKKIKKSVTEIEKKTKTISTNVDDLYETLDNFNVKLNSLEEENKSVNVSMNELNKQISSVRTCSNDALMSIKDLSKSVESTNQHYNEMSNKMDQLEISINLMSSQYTEQLENFGSLNKDKVDDLIGVVCQLVAKRLNPIDNLIETLNKMSTTKSPLSFKIEGIESQCVDLTNKIVLMESKCHLQNVGFYAWDDFDLIVGEYNLENFKHVCGNYGDHFDSTSGKFTIPFDGLYLLSISAKLHQNNMTELKSCQPDEEESTHLCNFFGSQTITFCAELKAGEQVFIKVKIEKDDMDECIDFSCCMLNC